MKTTNITILGGGSSAHTLIPLLSKANRNINIITSNPSLWGEKVTTEWQEANGEVRQVFEGSLNLASSDPKEVIPASDVIIFCMPVHKYNEALQLIAPFINPNRAVLVGTVYGQGGFNWMVSNVKSKFNLTKLECFAIGLIPWICRIKEYGKVGITYGAKSVNVVTFDKSAKYTIEKQELFHDICQKWFDKGEFRVSDNFISLTLSVDNQIIHPTRLYGLHQANPEGWTTIDDVPYFYKDYDDYSAQILSDLDNDYSKIRTIVKEINKDNDYSYMLNYLDLERLSYQSCNQNIRESFINSETLGAIKTPVVEIGNRVEINTKHRFFFDDIYYGIGIAKWFADALAVETPTIDKILRWSESMLNDKLLTSDSSLNTENLNLGIPKRYDLQDLAEIIS